MGGGSGERSRVIVWDLVGVGVESGARPVGLEKIGHGPPAFGSFSLWW